jgi:methionyl-tRNA synthetase
MLLSGGLPLPNRIVVHGFMTLEGQRISKTTGNTVDPVDLVAEFGADPVRYYVMRDVSLASDGDFSRANLIQRHNADLGNDLGNLLNRVVAMIGRYREGAVPTPPGHAEPASPEHNVRSTFERSKAGAARLIEEWDLDDALDAIWDLVRRTNQYLEERKPWMLAKDPETATQLDATLWTAAEATRLVALLLAPYIPGTSNRIMAQLGLPAVQSGAWTRDAQWGAGQFTSVQPSGTLFPRI